MPIPSLTVTVRNTERSVDRLSNYRLESVGLHPRHQYLIAELIMLRLFAIVEESIAEVASKVVSGTLYLSGTPPTRLFEAKSTSAAWDAMQTYGRQSRKRHLGWTTTGEICDNVAYVLANAEPFVAYARIHGGVLDEMRKVRNRIAHSSSRSKRGFQEVIRSTYGANRSLQVGVFLTSTQRQPRAKIDQYLVNSRVILREMAGG